MSDKLRELLDYLQNNSKNTINTQVISCYYFPNKTYIYQHKHDFVTIFGSGEKIYEVGQIEER